VGSGVKKGVKVAVYHNVVAPYRIPLFEELSKKVDLTVYFGRSKFEIRLWDVKYHRAFGHEILRDVGEFYLLSTINPTLPQRLLSGRFDIYVGADATLFGTQVAFLVSKFLRRPFILWTEERDYSREDRLTLSKTLIYKAVKTLSTLVTLHSDACVALGREAERRLRRLGVPRERIFVGPNAVPFMPLRADFESADGDEARRKFGIPENSRVILSLSYLRRVKGIQHLILAFKRLRDERKDVILVIVGTGPYEKELKAVQEKHNIPDILFVGYLPEEVKSVCFKMADIFVLPSLRDPWGLTINEAMICEKPIITTWDVGAKELVRDNGVIVPSGDEKKLYEAMARLLADEARLREMGKKSWQYVKEYSIEKESEAFLAAISYVEKAKTMKI